MHVWRGRVGVAPGFDTLKTGFPLPWNFVNNGSPSHFPLTLEPIWNAYVIIVCDAQSKASMCVVITIVGSLCSFISIPGSL